MCSCACVERVVLPLGQEQVGRWIWRGQNRTSEERSSVGSKEKRVRVIRCIDVVFCLSLCMKNIVVNLIENNAQFMTM